MKDAEKFISVPTDGFKTMEEMSAFAASSSHGSGFVEKMSIAGESVFVMRRSISWGGSTAEITFFRESQGRFLPALTMPMTIGEFRVEQRGDGIVVSRSDGKKRLDVFQIYRLP